MLRTIAAREVLDNLMSLKFLFGTILCLVLVVISTVVSLQDYQSRMEEYDNTLAEFEKNRSWSMVRILRKPEVLSIFACGFDKRFGNVTTSYASGRIPVESEFIETEESGQFAAGFASIDFVFVVKVILSLLAIFLSYDAISGEYERGTLKLALSRPVSKASIILGKLIAGGVCMLIPMVMSFILGILIIQLIGGVGFTSEDWLRVALIFGVSVFCVMSFYMIGLVVSGRTRRAATSLLILLLIWIIGVFLIPGITTAIMDRYRLKTPHPIDNIYAVWRDFSQNNPYKSSQGMSREAYNRYRLERYELEDETNRTIWSMQRRYLNRLHSQADLVRWICRISPSESYAYAAEALARTDVESYRSFMRYVRSYYEPHRELRKDYYRDREKFEAERENYSEPVEAPPMDFSASFRAAAPDICLLVVFNVLFFMLSVLFFVRYDVH